MCFVCCRVLLSLTLWILPACQALAPPALPTAPSQSAVNANPPILSERYTRIDALGQADVAVASQAWACVQDNRTQLIWEVKHSVPGLQFRDNSYTWYFPTTGDQDGSAGYPEGGQCTGSRCDTAAYIAAINERRLCGLTHWRLPTRHELKTLVDYNIPYPGPVIDMVFFPHTSTQFYWSADSDAGDPESAWGIGFSFGYDYAYFKSDYGRIRLVHDRGNRVQTQAPASAVDPRCHVAPILASTQSSGDKATQNGLASSIFSANGDGTVTDTRSGLMWMRCAVGQHWQGGLCQGEAELRPYAFFRRLVTQWHYAGHADWRIPSVTELDTITELSCQDPAINPVLFPNSTSDSYWSATPFVSDDDRQWLVHFLSGENHVELKSAAARVRLVRDVRESMNMR